MANPRKPSIPEWLFCIVILAVGITVVGASIFTRQYGTTPESELTKVEGVPADVELTHVTRRTITSFLKFRIAQHRIEWTSDEPKFKEIVDAVQSGEPVTVWISTKQETLRPVQGRVPLYKLSVEDKPVLDYSEVVAHKTEKSIITLVGGLVVSGIGLFAVGSGVRARFRYASNGGVASRVPITQRTERRRIACAAVFFSVTFYASLIGTNFFADVRAKWVEAFGSQPFGMPVLLVVASVQTLLYIPIPWVLWHMAKLTILSSSATRLNDSGYVLSAGGSRVNLQWSLFVCLGGLLYFFAVSSVWIVYASIRGI